MEEAEVCRANPLPCCACYATYAWVPHTNGRVQTRFRRWTSAGRGGIASSPTHNEQQLSGRVHSTFSCSMSGQELRLDSVRPMIGDSCGGSGYRIDNVVKR
eukprot:5200318-Heterocapsa_arctica.AAC.1